jgi:sugar phosphate isomerase/epimerase
MMSKSQAAEVAAALRQIVREKHEGLVRVGYQPHRGIVVETVKDGKATVVRETGTSKLSSTFDTLDGYDQWDRGLR